MLRIGVTAQRLPQAQNLMNILNLYPIKVYSQLSQTVKHVYTVDSMFVCLCKEGIGKSRLNKSVTAQRNYYEFIINYYNILFTFLLLKIDSKQKSIPVNFHKNAYLRTYIYKKGKCLVTV